MTEKNYESPSLLILQVLEAYPGCLFSVREIISEVYEKEGYNLDPHTVRDNINRLMLLNPLVYSKLQKVGPKKIPVFKYTLLKTPI